METKGNVGHYIGKEEKDDSSSASALLYNRDTESKKEVALLPTSLSLSLSLSRRSSKLMRPPPDREIRERIGGGGRQ